mmetsp:Transcript_12021/g.26377  ORF Transcript_12021/g.26377 Transcript_12021/m.26377 type:complete len:207 (-) Transcript_12021:840-1460(-)
MAATIVIVPSIVVGCIRLITPPIIVSILILCCSIIAVSPLFFFVVSPLFVFMIIPVTSPFLPLSLTLLPFLCPLSLIVCLSFSRAVSTPIHTIWFIYIVVISWLRRRASTALASSFVTSAVTIPLFWIIQCKLIFLLFSPTTTAASTTTATSSFIALQIIKDLLLAPSTDTTTLNLLFLTTLLIHFPGVIFILAWFTLDFLLLPGR